MDTTTSCHDQLTCRFYRSMSRAFWGPAAPSSRTILHPICEPAIEEPRHLRPEPCEALAFTSSLPNAVLSAEFWLHILDPRSAERHRLRIATRPQLGGIAGRPT